MRLKVDADGAKKLLSRKNYIFKEEILLDTVESMKENQFIPSNHYVAIDSNGEIVTGKYVLQGIIESKKVYDLNFRMVKVSQSAEIEEINWNGRTPWTLVETKSFYLNEEEIKNLREVWKRKAY